jgi:hypothetical protein
MRSSMAYFAGAGTVIAAIVAGVGGGLLMADIISPKSPKQELTRLERRMSPEPIPAATTPSEPVPYLAGAQTFASNPTVAPVPAPASAQPEQARSQGEQAQPQQQAQQQQQQQQQPQPQKEAANSQSTQERPAEASPAQPAVQQRPQPAAVAAQPVARAQPAASEDDSAARAKDAEAARAKDAEAKRVAEKRKAERRQQWAEKRRIQQRQDQEQLVTEDRVRGQPEPRQEFVVEPARIELPQIRLFDSE